MKLFVSLTSIVLFAIFVQSCSDTFQDENTSITVSLPNDSVEQMSQSLGTRAVSGKPADITSIIISVATASGESIGSGDILQSGNTITFSVPPHVPLVVKGMGYAGNLLRFQGQANIDALRPGEQSNASFTLNDIGDVTGVIAGTVRDAIDQEGPVPLAGVLITVTDVDNIGIATATTDVNGQYNIILPANITYTITFDLVNYISSTYANILVTPDQTNNLEAVLQVSTANAGVGDISGQILDSLNATPLAGVSLIFRAGINVTSGPSATQGSTDANGNFSISNILAAGNYTCELSLAGYITSYTSVLVIGGQVTGNQNATLTPIPVAGSTRIVLTWGLIPADLDSHLTGPITDNSVERFHIYFGDQTYPSSPLVGEGVIVAAAVNSTANLDVDDTDAEGPETITITSQSPGVFRYSVHDYTNKDLTVSSALSLSGAKVEVFRENQLVRVFNVPNRDGTLWTVFELDNDVITPIDTLTYEANETAIRSTIPQNDGHLLTNLPNKE